MNPVEPSLEIEAQQIPDKLYFRIGEVSRLAGVPAYVLRYWETEFAAIGPKKSGKGHRLYRRKDVELFLEIKRLLYEKRYTIEGARMFLHAREKPAAVKPAGSRKKQAELFENPVSSGLDEIRKELASILEMLR